MRYNRTHRLVNKDTGATIMPGSTLITRSDVFIFDYVSRVPDLDGGSNGKIVVHSEYGDSEIYPSVVNARIEAKVATGPSPTGRTSQRWYHEGYQRGLRDIRDQYVAGGQLAVVEWLRNNLQERTPGS